MQQLLSDAIDGFIVDRRSQSYSKGTINNQRSILGRLLTCLGNIYCHNITDRHVTRFFAEAARTRSVASLSNDHAALSVFFEWCRLTRRMPSNAHPMAGRRRPRRVQKERNRIHVSRFPALLDAAGDRDPRNRALLSCLLYLLVRDREMASIRYGDLDLAGGWVKVHVHKTGVEDTMPICAELDAELRTWLSIYTAKVGPLKPNYYLIPRMTSKGAQRGEGGRIVSHAFDYVPDLPVGPCGKLVKRSLESVGFATTGANGEAMSEGAHTIRRSGARALFDAACADGYDGALRYVQSVLHHKSVMQTETYLGITADRRNRDDRLRGNLMYPNLVGDNVVALTS